MTASVYLAPDQFHDAGIPHKSVNDDVYNGMFILRGKERKRGTPL
jgi:hypothetical protein